MNNNRSRQSKDDVTIEEIIKEREKEEAADNAAFCRSIARKRANRTQKLYGYKKNHTHITADTQELFRNDQNLSEQDMGHAESASLFTDSSVSAAESRLPHTEPKPLDESDAVSFDAFSSGCNTSDAEEPSTQAAVESPASLFDDIDTPEYADVSSDSEMPPIPTAHVRDTTPKKSRKLWLWLPLSFVLLVLMGYLTFVFVPIPFIRNLRDGYIGTAMTTADHQWLATAFIPRAIIDEVMGEIINPPEHPDDTDLNVIKRPDPATDSETAEQTTDTQTETETAADTAPNTEPLPAENDILGLASLKIGGKDYAGNEVILIDKEEGLYVSRINGAGFDGYAMLIDDPSRVFVGTTPEKTTRGYRIPEMMEYYGDVIAGINASGFSDPNDSGRGCDIIGYCMSEGESWGTYTNTMSSIVLTDENKLVVGWISNWEQYNIRDGMQFGPVLIKNGVNQIEGGGGYGWHPRTAIGQREDGVIIFLVIDGRVGTSLGCQIGDLSAIMLDYEAVNAGCCDGGSSVVLAYDGEVLNQNSSANPTYGRRIPNAFLVRSKKVTEE